MKPLAHLLAALAFVASAPLQAGTPTGPAITSRLAGTWYELASTPDPSQADCASDIVDRYLPQSDGTLALHRSCRTPTGRVETQEGRAWPEPAATGQSSRLKVSFLPRWLQWLPLRRSEVSLVALDEPRGFAVLAAPQGQGLWLLSRSPVLPAETLREIVDRLAAHGYPTHRLVLTHQSRPDAWIEPGMGPMVRRVHLMV